MNAIKATLALLVVSSIFGAAVASTAQDVLVIRDVTVIDVSKGTVNPSQTVVVKGDRITHVGRRLRIPTRTTVIDGRGKFLIPGLCDIHVHALRPERVDTFFKLFIANGVTGILCDRITMLFPVHPQSPF